MRRLGTAIVLALAISSAHAYEIRPGYLQIHQTNAETYDVLWKVPAGGGLRQALEVTFPEGTTELRPPTTESSRDSFTRRWSVRREGGLTGGAIRVDGLAETS